MTYAEVEAMVGRKDGPGILLFTAARGEAGTTTTVLPSEPVLPLAPVAPVFPWFPVAPCMPASP